MGVPARSEAMPTTRRTPTRRVAPARPGFTLIETALATVIIGVGVLAMMDAFQGFLRANSWSTQSSTATLLAGEIREMSRTFPRHDAFAGGIYFENPTAHTTFRGWGPEPDETDPSMFDDIDDFDGAVFGSAADSDLPGPVGVTGAGVAMRYPGPIDAFAAVIPETDWAGVTATDGAGADLPLQGWSQYVRVEKVDPADYTVTRADDYYEPAAGATPELEVDQFPLRVTVWALYQGPFDTSARVVARHTWVVPR